MRHGWKTEADLAARVVAWLRADDWKVYQEVDCPHGIADVVAVKGRETLVVEAKLHLNLHLLEQAHRWLTVAHQVLIAVPHYTYRCPTGYRFGLTVAKKLTLGVLTVRTEPSALANYPNVPANAHIRFGIERVIWGTQNIQAPYDEEKKFIALSKYLHDEQQSYSAAGSATGKRWTPFKGTVQTFTEYVTKHPGCTIKEVCTNAKHHWLSTSHAVASMRGLVVEPNPKHPPFPGIEARHDPALRAYRLYPRPR